MGEPSENEGVPESWQPLRSKTTGEAVTLTWDQIYAVQRAFSIWQQVVDKEQADRDPQARQSYMLNPANWQKSCLLGRLLTTGKPPLPVPPPRYMSGPWYEVIENNRADLHGDQFNEVYGPVEHDGRRLFNIAGDIGWEVVRKAAPEGWIVSYPGHGEWLLRHRTNADPPAKKGTSIASGQPVTIWMGPLDWVLERTAGGNDA
jgi:hypothetical protein